MEWGPNNSNTAEDKVEIGPLKVASKGPGKTDIVPILTFVAVCVIAYGGYQHDAASKDDNRALSEAIKDNTKVQREQVAVQREANCLSRLTTEEKKNPREIEFCKQLGRER